MLPFRKILFPVDFSPPCAAVAPHIADMMGRFTAEPVLLHVYQPGIYPYVGDAESDARLLAKAEANARQQTENYAAELFPGQTIECMVDTGDPATAIRDAISTHGADLVMMPTHGCGPLRRLLLGSTTAKVLHDVEVPVWTGTGHALEHHQPGIPYQSILCALEDGEEAEGVLKAAAVMAEEYAAQLHIVNVLHIVPAGEDISVEGLLNNLKKIANDKLDDLKESLGVDAPHEILLGEVTDTVVKAAVESKADLIVTGRGHMRAGISRLWSHLYAIVRHAPCPVLSI